METVRQLYSTHGAHRSARTAAGLMSWDRQWSSDYTGHRRQLLLDSKDTRGLWAADLDRYPHAAGRVDNAAETVCSSNRTAPRLSRARMASDAPIQPPSAATARRRDI